MSTFHRMKNPSHQELLTVCEQAAREAGEYALRNIHRRGEIAQSFDHDVKLVMDSECQRIAEQVIHKQFPHHAVLGEEGSIAGEHAFEWIIDPIDGTANYTRNLPHWCCSIAVRCDSEILAGCVFIPAFDECYTAAADGPALCNGSPIHPSTIQSLSEATFFTGLTKDLDPRSLDFFCTAAPQVNKIRILGSAAIDLCHVACGRSDAYFEAGLYLWDVAAGALIAERAGAVCTAWPRDEAHGLRFLCSNRHIHSAARQLAAAPFGLEI